MANIRENFGNSWLLTRFALKREKWIALAWAALMTLVMMGVIPILEQAFHTGGHEEIVEIIEMPAMVFIIGPSFNANFDDFGALYTVFLMLFAALTMGIMNIFLVTRYTRTDEEAGRYEVIRSLPTGRLANLNSAMLTAVIVNIAMGLAVALGIFIIGDDTMGLHGSLLWGASLAVSGLVFAAITALFTQLSASSRGAMGYSFMLLAFFYIIRAPGNMNPDLAFLSYISPLGLVLNTQAYIANNWWPVFILLGVAAVITAVAFLVNSIRDIDQGIIPARAGRAHGSFLMKSPFGLSFKLMRSSLIAWVAGMFILAASYGSVLGAIDDFLAQSDMYQQIIFGPADIKFLEGATPEETVKAMHAAVEAAGFTMPQLFSGAIINIMALVVTAPAVLFILKAKSEEKNIRSEIVLATPVCRNKYLAGFAIFAFASVVVMQIAQAVGMYAVGITALEDPSLLSLGFLMQANLIFVPALWVMVGLAIFLIGAAPKLTGIVWGIFAYSFLVMFIGRMGVIPEWAGWLSPFEFVTILPLAPGESVNFIALGIMLVIAAGLTAAGFAFYNKRDINAITH